MTGRLISPGMISGRKGRSWPLIVLAAGGILLAGGCLFSGLGGLSYLLWPRPQPPAFQIATVGPLPTAAHRQPTMAATLLWSGPVAVSPTPAPTPSARSEPERAAPLAPSPTVTPTPAANRLVIPAIELEASILPAPLQNQQWQVDQLGQAIGHLEGTAPPGADGNLVLAGHVRLPSGEAGPFARLHQLERGDIVLVYMENRPFEYRVETQREVDRTAIEVTLPTGDPRLTLLTCSGWNPDLQRYDRRLVVTGHLRQK